MKRTAISMSRCIVGVILLSVQIPSAQACEQTVFGKLDTGTWNQLQGKEPAERARHLESLGVTRDDWLPKFRQASEHYISSAPAAKNNDADVVANVLHGVTLAGLLVESETSDTLKQLATSPGSSEAIVYASLLSLDAFGTELEFLLSATGNGDSRIARLAILAVGLRTDPVVASRLSAVRKARARAPGISGALQQVDMCNHDRRRYEALSGVGRKVQFVEERLRRAYNPVNGMTQTWDPHSGGHPLSRWARQRWRELSKSNPARLVAHVNSIRDYPTRSTSGGYRRFLAEYAGEVVMAQVSD